MIRRHRNSLLLHSCSTRVLKGRRSALPHDSSLNRIGLHPLVCKCQKAFSFRRDAWHSQVKEDNFDSESAGDGIYEVALNRRSFFFGVTSLGSVCQTPAQAADAKLPLTCVLDNSEGYSIGIPEGWYSGTGEISAASSPTAAAGTRKGFAWFPDDSAKDVNVTLVITNSAADFTSLDSFGNADSFASNLVNSMDQSYLLRAPKWARRGMEDKDIQVAKLIDSSKANGGYFVEYTIRNSSVQQHLISFIYLGFNGRYNRIYTITAQCPEDALHKYKSTFLAICKSFRVRDTTSLPE